MQELSDLELITQLQQGDKNALNILMGRYKHKLYAFVKRYGVDDDTAYDIVQETFIKVYFKVSSFNHDYNFSTWLYQIAINLCRDHSRKEKRNPIESEEIADIASGTINAEETLVLKNQLSRLNKAITLLPHKLKTALVMFAIEERSQEECAALLGITPKTLETRVYRARKILADKISSE